MGKAEPMSKGGKVFPCSPNLGNKNLHKKKAYKEVKLGGQVRLKVGWGGGMWVGRNKVFPTPPSLLQVPFRQEGSSAVGRKAFQKVSPSPRRKSR